MNERRKAEELAWRPARHVRMPGLPREDRLSSVRAGSVPIDATLPEGARLLDAVHDVLDQGIESACLTLSGGTLFPFSYVIPAVSPDANHAAFYSDRRHAAGPVHLDAAAITVGFRAGAPFFHCHALWTEADGRQGCGHVLPDDTVIRLPIRAEGAGLIGARFEVQADVETGFSLFVPAATGTTPPARATPALAVRLAPNQDLIEALELAGRSAGFTRAQVAGGVASIIEARFADAAPVTGFATELLVRHGDVRCVPGPETVLEIAIVDLHGTIGGGRLVPGDNPVLMTFEGALIAR